jgi:ABC-type nitrate/sulfonate/bicarbonate transport system substrate-binding protein
VLLAIGACGIWLSCSNRETTDKAPDGKLVTVRFANLPYADHTIAAIGVEKGFFKDAGIDLHLETIKVEEAIPSLINGKVDAISIPPGIIFSSFESAPGVIAFVFSDLFQGYALLAQPNTGYKRYADFVAEGKTHSEAIAATVQQIKGKTFAYPAETAIKPFIDKLLSDSSMSASDYKPLVLDDPLTISAMRKKEADFQVGGVPSRIQLEKDGFVVLISSSDIAKGAKPSADSTELAAVLQNSWATTKAFSEKHPDLVLSLAGVNYRIMQFIKDHEAEAAAIHMRYLTKVTGQQFTEQDAKVIYHSLDPFFTFEAQKPWFHDKQSPFYYEYVNGAILNSFVTKGIFKNRVPTVEDVVFADDTYRSLEALQSKAESAIATLSTRTLNAASDSALTAARERMSAFDFKTALRLAEKAGSGPN